MDAEELASHTNLVNGDSSQNTTKTSLISTNPYVFISYARSDSATVDSIVAGLETAGIRTWRDTSEIRPGADWASAIEDAVNGAAAHVYIASANSLSSSWMEQELLFAHSRSKSELTIIPLNLVC